jgi:hypothetical protein
MLEQRFVAIHGLQQQEIGDFGHPAAAGLRQACTVWLAW